MYLRVYVEFFVILVVDPWPSIVEDEPVYEDVEDEPVYSHIQAGHEPTYSIEPIQFSLASLTCSISEDSRSLI